MNSLSFWAFSIPAALLSFRSLGELCEHILDENNENIPPKKPLSEGDLVCHITIMAATILGIAQPNNRVPCAILLGAASMVSLCSDFIQELSNKVSSWVVPILLKSNRAAELLIPWSPPLIQYRPDLKENQPFLVKTIPHNFILFDYASDALKTNLKFVAAITKKEPAILTRINQFHSFKDPQAYATIIRSNPATIPYFSVYILASEHQKVIRKTILDLIAQEPNNATHLILTNVEHKQILIEAFKQRPALIADLPTSVKDNPWFPSLFWEAFQKTPEILRHCDESFLRAQLASLITEIIRANHWGKGPEDMHQETGPDQKSAPESADAATERKIPPTLWECVPETLKQDQKFLLQAIQKDPRFFLLAPEELSQSIDFCLNAIAANPQVHSYFRDHSPLANLTTFFTEHRTESITLITQNPHLFSLLPETLRSDCEFVNILLEKHKQQPVLVRSMMKQIPQSFFPVHREYSLTFVTQAPCTFSLLPEELRRDQDFVNILLEYHKQNQTAARPIMKEIPQSFFPNHRDCSLALVTQDPFTFSLLPEELRRDQDFVNILLEYHKQNQTAARSIMETIPQSFFSDRKQLSLDLVTRDPLLFRLLPEEFRREEAFIKILIEYHKQNPMGARLGISCIPEQFLQNHTDLFLPVAEQDPLGFYSLPRSLQDNPAMLKKVLASDKINRSFLINALTQATRALQDAEKKIREHAKKPPSSGDQQRHLLEQAKAQQRLTDVKSALKQLLLKESPPLAPVSDLALLPSTRPFGINNETWADCFLNTTLQQIIANRDLVRAIIATNDPNLAHLIRFLSSPLPSYGALTDSSKIRDTLYLISENPDFLERSRQMDCGEVFGSLMTYLTTHHAQQFLAFSYRERKTISSKFAAAPDEERTEDHTPAPLIITNEHANAPQEALDGFFGLPVINQNDDKTTTTTETRSIISNPPETIWITCSLHKPPTTIISHTLSLSQNYFSPPREQAVTYRMSGFAVHSGSATFNPAAGYSSYGGHWIAYREIDGAYYEISDSTVSSTPLSETEYLAKAKDAAHYFFQKVPVVEEFASDTAHPGEHRDP